MLFSSPVFFVFFAAYFVFHLLLPRQWRLHLIICGSTIFYAWWKVEYVWLPYLLMAIAYFGAIWMLRAKEETARKWRAGFAIALLFAPLVFFKYTNFFYNDVFGALTGGGKIINVTLPLGVSFVTFTLTAYIVDIYRGRFSGQIRPLTVLAYVLFFPHLIAGPILRPIELIPQLEHPRRKKSLLPTAGAALFTIGLVKKLVIADTLAGVVDAIYSQPGPLTGPAALLAIYGFSVQIYCDFSGYTDMAIGLAMLLGIRLPRNFSQPYCADSIIDFWRRWHMTLSFWLRDYLYIPLGGNRGGKLNEIRNIMITMALGGLWHGASWTFVIWGVLHGIGVSAVHAARELLRWTWLRRMPHWVGVLLTFHFVTLAWVFFRAPRLGRAADILSGVAGSWVGTADYISAHVFEILLIVVFFVLHKYDDNRRIRIAAMRLRPEILWPGLVALWAIAITVSQGSSAKFIYFDF
jgi:alginate O-acetyltransferase complex protein AlgI